MLRMVKSAEKRTDNENISPLQLLRTAALRRIIDIVNNKKEIKKRTEI